MKAINILWDVDEEDGDLDDLPTEMEIPWYLEDADDETISDYLTDSTGFCHKGFDLIRDESVCECPLGEDESNDCANCVYGIDKHFEDGECVCR